MCQPPIISSRLNGVVCENSSERTFLAWMYASHPYDLHSVQCRTMRLAILDGSESWTLKGGDVGKLKAVEMTYYRRVPWVSWKDHRTNESVLHEIGADRESVASLAECRTIARDRRTRGELVRRPWSPAFSSNEVGETTIMNFFCWIVQCVQALCSRYYHLFSVADPGLSEGVRFRQGHRDAEVVDGNRVWERGVPSPPQCEVWGGAVSLSEFFWEKKTLGILHFVVFSCVCKQLLNLQLLTK